MKQGLKCCVCEKIEENGLVTQRGKNAVFICEECLKYFFSFKFTQRRI